MQRRHVLLAGLGLTVSAFLPIRPALAKATGAPPYILGATAVTRVFGNGQRLIGVAIEQDRPVEAEALNPALYSVEGRTITRVYAATEPGVEAQYGHWIMLDLSPDDAAAQLFVTDGRTTTRHPAATTVTITPGGAPVTPESGPPSGPPDFNTIPRSIPTDAAVNLVVDNFLQDQFHDAKTGDTLAYNLFEPKDRDPQAALPLVLFMHDAGNTSPVIDTTLVQGLGAIGWASPEDQARHACLVLAPQYASQTVNDDSQATSLLDTTLHLLDHIAATRNVDRKRIYVTGQSGGGMMSIAMMVRHPDLFAAAFLVACQWDPAVVQPLARQRLWVVVAEGDAKAFPGQNAIMKVIEAEGTAHSEAIWDGTSDAATLDKAVAEQAAQGKTVNYSVLQKGTVVPPGQVDNPGANHVNTWRIAYDIPAIRDWILQQVKPG
ncbi:prolyl oligopeptidase family serine peptidase [Tabrizicola sp. J26]|uniref:prolyl oligopeptidase family serine peptidase n=1 Tax=Alitabrizicola rongguiensis TaxID=2909234 RepID=UPI001F16D7F3|nr:prolyl oligopeptidase family serine peptidase [Tabrizicola rongguiensis]MCF1708934.1 prolyl oligopeptidase family serine peptidase [Tabrizicola rongguiensis]